MKYPWKICLAIACCALGTAIGWFAIKEFWFLLFLSGPLQRLTLGLSQLGDNPFYFVEGQSTARGADRLIASFHFAVWIAGVVAVFYGFIGKSTLAKLILGFGWLVVAGYNFYEVAMRGI